MRTIAPIIEMFKGNNDFTKRNFNRGESKITFFYLKSISDERKIGDQLVNSFYMMPIQDYMEYLQSYLDWSKLNLDTAVEKILNGSVIIEIGENLFSIGMQKFEGLGVSEISSENIIIGSKTSINEDLSISLNLIKNRYRSEHLSVIQKTIGIENSSKVAILYNEVKADRSVLNDVMRKLDGIPLDLIPSAGQVMQKVNSSKWTLFPTMMISERPDRIVKNLSQGKIVILVEGTPFALIAPAVFFDFFVTMDEVVQLSIVSKFLISLRYIALFITIFLPALYVRKIKMAGSI